MFQVRLLYSLFLIVLIVFSSNLSFASDQQASPKSNFFNSSDGLQIKESVVQRLDEAVQKMNQMTAEGRYQEALDIIVPALRDAEPYINDAPWLLSIHAAVGHLYFMIDSFAQAKTAFEKALAYPQQRAGYETAWKTACQELMYSLVELEEYDKALMVLEQQLKFMAPDFYNSPEAPLFTFYVSQAFEGIGKIQTAIFFKKYV